jgi:cation transport regulator ChaB
MKNLKPVITAAVIVAVFILAAVAMAQFPRGDKQNTTVVKEVAVNAVNNEAAKNTSQKSDESAEFDVAVDKGMAAPPDAFMSQGGPGTMSGGPGALSGGPGGNMPGNKHGMMEPFSSDDVKEFEAWLKKEDPDGYAEIQEIKTVKPMEYGRIVFEFTRNMRLMKILEKKDPEASKGLKDEMVYDVKLRKLCRQYREATDDAKKKTIKAEITVTLDKLFDVRTINRQREISKLEEKVKELRGLIEKRKNNKKLIVERKLAEVTGSYDGLEW